MNACGIIKKDLFSAPTYSFLIPIYGTSLLSMSTFFCVLSGLEKLICYTWEFYYLILMVCERSGEQDSGLLCVAEDK